MHFHFQPNLIHVPDLMLHQVSNIFSVSAMLNFKNDFELTGAEDPAILTSYVTALSATEGYREGTALPYSR